MSGKQKRNQVKQWTFFWTPEPNKLLFQYILNSWNAHIVNIRGDDVLNV